MFEETNSLVRMHELPTMEEARNAANDRSTNTFGQVCPVILFRQGERTCASTAIPVSIAVKVLASDPVEKKASLENVKLSYNRPINKDHVRAVSRYLTQAVSEQSKYILPSLTVTAKAEQHIYTTAILNNNFTQLGYLVLNIDDSSLTTTDGQHRLEGLKQSLAELEGDELMKLKSDSVPIMFSFESDIKQVHQDFADCSKTKALPKSMIAVYDRRVPVNGLIMDIVDSCDLFSDGRTDSTSVSLSKKSNCFVLTNSIRTILKALLTGNQSMADKAFDSYADKNLSDKNRYVEVLEDTISTVNLMTEYHPVLSEVARLPRGPQRQKLVDFREKYLIANPFGLALACKVVNKYLALGLPDENKEKFIQKMMQELDWKKSSKLWKGNVITERSGKFAISSTNKPVTNAVEAIGEALGIDLEPKV